MKIAVFNTKSYDKIYLSEANKKHQHECVFFEVHLDLNTYKLAEGFEAVCVFVNDQLDKDLLTALYKIGVRLISLRCAGYNNIDVKTAIQLGFTITRVPAYSPHGVAEHAVAIMLSLNRKIYKSHNRIRDGNFSLEGLMGFEMFGKTAGIIGTGKIGMLTANILAGFGTKILAYDTYVNPDLTSDKINYVDLDQLYSQSDIISLHLPLTHKTHHIINDQSISLMKNGVMIINTSRGGLIDTQSVINGLKSAKIGYLGLDVYEEEGDLFFEDLSGKVLQDDVFARLLTFPNVIITGHQAFFTDTALKNIAETTIQNITDFEQKKIDEANIVKIEMIK